jgi:hypothetical protein
MVCFCELCTVLLKHLLVIAVHCYFNLMLNYKTFLECGCKDKNLFLNKKINKVILTKFENH